MNNQVIEPTIAKKKRFKVRVETTSVTYINVEADSEDHAEEIGTTVDDKYFKNVREPDWELLDATEDPTIEDDELLPAELYNWI